jgi:hypothetical protein
VVVEGHLFMVVEIRKECETWVVVVEHLMVLEGIGRGCMV